jgi:hypothetical protein
MFLLVKLLIFLPWYALILRMPAGNLFSWSFFLSFNAKRFEISRIIETGTRNSQLDQPKVIPDEA